MGELRRAVAMVACVAGALLAVDLTAAAADFAAGLGGLGALALGGQLAANDQVQDALVDLGGEDRFAQLDLPAGVEIEIKL